MDDRHIPLRLDKALELAFPAGGMTVSGLRRERDRGNLVVERIAGKDFVTLAAIEDMREKCRVVRTPQQSTSRGTDHRAPATSMTEQASLAQVAAKATDAALRKHLEGIRRAGAAGREASRSPRR